MTDCGISVIALEMATSRDVQSARVTEKELKDAQSTDTTKRDQQCGNSFLKKTMPEGSDGKSSTTQSKAKKAASPQE